MVKELTPAETTKLATYNSEVARGLIHTEKWRGYMTALQTRFNRSNEVWNIKHGGEPMPESRGDGWIFWKGVKRCSNKNCRCRYV